jgi:alpha-beta hydrolase superfamily lysophospholipase
MSTPPTADRWDEPVGATPRGTVIVLGGRGESAAVYGRFGRRLSADAYRVRAVEDVTLSVARSVQLVRSIIAESEVGPVVIVGSDAGAVLALRLASDSRLGLAAVIAAGLPNGTGIAGDAQAQIDVRTACPVHRGVLADPDALDPLALSRDLPANLTLPRPGDVAVPLLAFHGGADLVAGPAAALAYYEDVPNARVAIVQDGRHDILNDVSHRSVAATVVLFLEELRNNAVPTLQFAGAGAR